MLYIKHEWTFYFVSLSILLLQRKIPYNLMYIVIKTKSQNSPETHFVVMVYLM